MFVRARKLLQTGVVATGIACWMSPAESQTAIRSNVPTEIHSSIPNLTSRNQRYRQRFNKWVLSLPHNPKVRAEIDALVSMPYNVNTEQSEHAELVFNAHDLPELLRGQEMIFMNINRYDAGLKNTADQIVFVIDKYADAKGPSDGRKYMFKANAVYNLKLGRFENRIER
jgi:hypothetical protein